ncbi:MAG TPA: NAD(P)/FAD-dependent oxidoreductase [Candidatus Polarisedimenticolaceae bacterium]|nr:NAD(P)/FAD-dependent oxidoreductase [Candidatus Polarisedimenticolaceae bacterium]
MARWDLLVLGGGPAGAATAALAAGAGARVLLVEREVFPRDKVCGEFLSAEALPVLRELGVEGALREAGAPPIERCRVSEPGGRTLDAPLPQAGLGVSRALLDQRLLDLARRRGVTVWEGVEATAALWDGTRVAGAVVGREVPQEIRASVVVAADGRRSMLARRLHATLGDPARSTAAAWFGFKTHRGGGGLGARVDLHVFDGGYAGLAAVEGDRVNVCLLATVAALRRCGGRPEHLLERVRRNPAAREALRGTEDGARWHSIGPLRFGVRKPASAGALFVGDAAGTIDPFAGEGMSHALLGARLAAPVALEAARWGSLTEEMEARYCKAWTDAFAPATARARRLARLLERPLAATAAVTVLRAIGEPAFARLVAHSRTAEA